ncbi:MAG: hypothetical protein A2896_02225 [Candidatus Nealsonbacteria bacterium RIFCSPLOWO2_01_FULL_43_32]|uniref:Uncharacterized protein n=1 Tax=Candidatus Nealsonbacteria bacterium RIFCSPLOWO2_01_FULL_43_32 TaxID=1801672 RepID=A0A1G2EG82_9BACT|nr:MAG: hypothetical protein A2896_02225 [Candidatus Nealsonbacteria bacterium RIFCSPLOWO2_01_FULL_43_32]
MKRTIQKALRSSKTLNPPPGIRAKTIERIEGLVKEALNGSKFSDRYIFVLNYLSTVVSFHQAADQKIKDKLFIQIGKNGDKGHALGFDQEELISLNFLVLRAKQDGQLPTLAQRIKEKELNGSSPKLQEKATSK